MWVTRNLLFSLKQLSISINYKFSTKGLRFFSVFHIARSFAQILHRFVLQLLHWPAISKSHVFIQCDVTRKPWLFRNSRRKNCNEKVMQLWWMDMNGQVVHDPNGNAAASAAHCWQAVLVCPRAALAASNSSVVASSATCSFAFGDCRRSRKKTAKTRRFHQQSHTHTQCTTD